MLGKTYFRVDFEGLTRMVREYWAEGSYTLATSILTDSGIPINVAHDIIRGKLKMIQDPEGKPGVDGAIDDDNWSPDESYSYMGKYPDPDWFRLIHRYGTEGLKDLRYAAEWAVTAMNNSTYSLDKIRILKEVKHVPEEIYEYFKIPDPSTIHTGDLYTGDLYEPEIVRLNTIDMSYTEAASLLREDRLRNNIMIGSPDVDTFIKQQLEFDNVDKLEPDKSFSKPLGWILPDGKFYSCEYMQHNVLADALANFNRDQANAAGWVEITHPLNQPRNYQILYGAKELTQKQLDTLFDWQQIYGQGNVINPAGEW